MIKTIVCNALYASLLDIQMKSKMLGGILLIAGTCIGGGMLSLPIATAKGGLFGALLLFIVCWALMTFTALLTLEVNLYFPAQSNVISMTKATLGRFGEIISWTIYLLFLYALVSAYVAGGQDLLSNFLSYCGLHLPLWVSALIFVVIFGSVVMAGIEIVDVFNRLLVIFKLGTIFLLMSFIAFNIDTSYYANGHASLILPATTVAITSFGFSIIVPSLRSYFNDDIKKLKIAIIVGSLLALLCYVTWVAVIFGLIPITGAFGLERLMNETQPISGLINSINYYLPIKKVNILANTFSSICVLTAFACVSLGLADYLADGFKVDKDRRGKLLITLSTFLPPLLIVIFYPKAFMLFLSLAGLCCVFLQSLLPAIMAWNCRYSQKLPGTYQVYGGKITLMLAMLTSALIILLTISQMSGLI